MNIIMKNKWYFYISLLTILFSIPVLQFGWYVQDDYNTLSVITSHSYSSAAQDIIDWLYNGQGRFQPVRLIIFTFLTLKTSEEVVIFINVIFHTICVILGVLFLIRLRINRLVIWYTSILFSCTATWRMIESPSTMIGGDGLIFFFIILSSILYIRFLVNNSLYSYLVSIVLYIFAVFSYENSIPLVLIYCTIPIYLHCINTKPLPNPNRCFFTIVPYFLPILLYILFFWKSNGGYSGSTIKISTDVFLRLYSYTYELFTFGIKPKFKSYGIYYVLLPFYFLIVSLYYKSWYYNEKANFQELGSGLIFFSLIYFVSLVLFIANDWQTPKHIMVHHLYIPSFAASVVTATVLSYFQFRYNLHAKYTPIIIACTFITLTSPSIKYKYQEVFKTKGILLQVRAAIVDNYNKSQVVILENFKDLRAIWSPLMSGMDGALRIWLRNDLPVSGTDLNIQSDNYSTSYKYPLTLYFEPDHTALSNTDNIQVYEFDHEGFLHIVGKSRNQFKDFEIPYESMIPQFCYAKKTNSKLIFGGFVETKNNNAIYVKVSSVASFLKNSAIFINGKAPEKYIKISDNDLVFYLPSISNFANVKILSFADRNELLSIGSYNTAADFKANYSIPKIFDNFEQINNIKVNYSEGFYKPESNKDRFWVWSDTDSILEIINSNKLPVQANISFDIKSFGKSENPVVISDYSVRLNHKKFVVDESYSSKSYPIKLIPGVNKVYFKGEKSGKFDNDPRKLSFSISNVCLY